MMKPTKIAFAVVSIASLATLAASTLAFAAGQTSANFAMPLDSINNGVGRMSSANFNLSSSVGDAVATGNITSVSFVLSSGFRGQDCRRVMARPRPSESDVAQFSRRQVGAGVDSRPRIEG